METNDEGSKMRYDCVILANGDFPTHHTPLSILEQASFLCCCDGAAQVAIEHGLKPRVIVGDGDSMTKGVKTDYSEILHLVSEQEDNDLTKATRYCKQQGFSNIAYIGATGKREDHTIGNIFLLPRYLRDFNVSARIFTDNGFFLPAEGTTVFKSFPSQQVSIFNISCTEIKSNGLRWESYAYRELWQGTLNESVGNSFTLHADGSYIVFQTYEKKIIP